MKTESNIPLGDTSCSMSSFVVPVMEDGDGQYAIHPVTGKRIDRPNEWKPPNPDLSWRVLSDPCIATGIYHADGSMMTHIEVGSESELRASRCLATGVRNKSGKHKGITPQCGVGVLSYSLQIRLKGVYAIKRLGKLILQCFKGRCAHGGIDSYSSNVEPSRRREWERCWFRVCGADAGRLRRFVGHLFFDSSLNTCLSRDVSSSLINAPRECAFHVYILA